MLQIRKPEAEELQNLLLLLLKFGDDFKDIFPEADVIKVGQVIQQHYDDGFISVSVYLLWIFCISFESDMILWNQNKINGPRYCNKADWYGNDDFWIDLNSFSLVLKES